MDISGAGGEAARVLAAAEMLGKKVRILSCEELSGRERRIIRRSKILFLDRSSEKAMEAAKAAKEKGVPVFLMQHGEEDPGLSGLADILITSGGDKALTEMASMGRTALSLDKKIGRAHV